MKGRTAFGKEPPPKPRRKKRKGMFLGGIFGAGEAKGAGSSSQTSSQSTTNTQIDPGGQYYPLQQSVLGVGEGLLNKEYQAYDPNLRFAETNQDQQAAQQGVRNAQGAWQPNFAQGQQALNQGQTTAAGVGTAGQTAFNTAAGGPGGLAAANPYLNKAGGSWTDPGRADAWMNPYTKNVTDAAVQQANEAFRGPGGALEGLTGAFTGGGGAQFGRERMGDVAGKLTTDFGRGLSQTIAGINQQGYNQGMTAFGNEAARQGTLAGTAGQLGVSDVTSQTSLGTAQTNAQEAATRANIAAGQAQTGQGSALSGAQYKDASMLGTSGATQQEQEQRYKDFSYQTNREAFDWDRQRAAQAQGLAQGWQLPTTVQSTSQGSSSQGTTQPTGSVAGNVLGAAATVGGMSTGKDTTVAGDVGNWLGNQFAAEGGHIQAAHGGHLAFGPGGQVPVTRAVRARAQRRQPGIMARLQAMGGPGITPGQTPGMMAPKPAFASGGQVYPVQSRRKDYELYHPSQWQEMWPDVGGWARGGGVPPGAQRAVHRHERGMHRGQPLTAFAEGGPASYGFSDMSPAEQRYIRRLQQQEENARRAGHDPRPATDRLTERRQADFEERLRGGEHEAAYAADPGGYWNNFGRGALRGALSPAVLAGIPGSINNLAFGDRNKWPTMTDVGNFLDRGTGHNAGAPGAHEGNMVGNIGTGAYSLSGAPGTGIEWLRKLGRLGALGDRIFRYGSPPAGVATAFGD